METFLNNGIAMMKREDIRELLKSKVVTAPGLKLIEMQRAGWEALGIERDIGCSYLECVEDTCPGGVDILRLREAFVMEAKRSFVRALEDRRPVTLERKKKIIRDFIVHFLDACNSKMDVPETSLRLKKHLEKIGNMLLEQCRLERATWRGKGCSLWLCAWVSRCSLPIFHGGAPLYVGGHPESRRKLKYGFGGITGGFEDGA